MGQKGNAKEENPAERPCEGVRTVSAVCQQSDHRQHPFHISGAADCVPDTRNRAGGCASVDDGMRRYIMKKIFDVAGALLMFIGMAAGNSITMEQTSIACMIAPVIMIAAGAGIMAMTKEGKR